MRKSADEFRALLRDALSNAQLAAGRSAAVDPDPVIELHLHGVHDRTLDEAARDLFIDEEHFFSCIDVSVHPKRSESGVYFVRASGHEPAGWERTRHPDTTGPFHIMTPA